MVVVQVVGGMTMWLIDSDRLICAQGGTWWRWSEFHERAERAEWGEWGEILDSETLSKIPRPSRDSGGLKRSIGPGPFGTVPWESWESPHC